jgi:hypothetical protein
MLDNFDDKPQTRTNIRQQYRPRNTLFRRQRQRTFELKSMKPLKAQTGSGNWRNGLVRGATYPPPIPQCPSLVTPNGLATTFEEKEQAFRTKFFPPPPDTDLDDIEGYTYL